MNGVSSLKARYIRGQGLIAREDETGKAYYLHNGHGDVVELRDSTGDTRLNRYSYDMWGNPIVTEESVQNPFRYSGEMTDSTTTLQYLRARWYDPSMGRFINEDSYEGKINNPLSLNLYTYVENNPLIYTDPTGYCKAGKDAGCYVDSNSGVDKMISDPELANNSQMWKDYQGQKAYCKNSSCVSKLEAKQKVLEQANDKIRNSACIYVDCYDGEAKFTGMDNGMPIITQDAENGKKKYTLTKVGVIQCNCFTAGTKVQTNQGEKPIEEIQVGDKVLSKNEKTGDVDYKKVTATFKHDTDEIYKINVGSQTIEATFNHPFWVNGKGWVVVKDLIVGDSLVQSNGNTLKIDNITIVNENVTVYNMTVDEFHTYFVSDLNIWVHNTSSCFPEDPNNFNPTGLIKREFPGTKNGRIIKWFDPVTNKPIYEWNEDLKYGNHYHYTPNGNIRAPHPVTRNTHIKGGDAMIEYMEKEK
ncbi:polymorphic toxin-type HINT domain-containing protein [Cohnella mopanensis]|uniref:polymorphic toxin-type HINT domain-containing protein n=1 Tax=Cohnella mopanensis TaxID=2911966 RepID=UPI001EF94F75